VESGALAIMGWAAHYVQVAAAMLIFGGALFAFYVKSSSGSGSWHKLSTLPLAGALCLSALLAAALKIADVTGESASLLRSGDLADFFFGTSFGGAWLARLVLSASVFAGALGFAGLLRVRRGGDKIRNAVFLLLSGLTLLSFASAGHASALASGAGAYAAIAWEGIHLLAAGAWIGGLFPLLFSVQEAAGANMRVSGLPALRSFSVTGQWTVAALILGGTAALGVLMGNWQISIRALGASSYGETLIVKHALVTIMLAIAAINRFVLLPGLTSGTAHMSQMRRAILLECALGALAIAAGITLSQSQPPEAG
jgi:copper resistance protein D